MDRRRPARLPRRRGRRRRLARARAAAARAAAGRARTTAGSRSTRAICHRAGDGERARELAVEAAEIGRRFGVPDLEMLGLALEGASLVADARVDEGMRRLDEATATALEGQAEIPISGAWACCFLVSACLAVYDFERAFAWCDRIAEFAERYGSR